jgi:hypothetical protein
MALLFHTTSHTLFLLALFYKWFALDDRYAVFLYEHLGATPFDAVTTSRYLMAGLVACGAVMFLYLTLNFALARLVANYRAPVWTRVWATSALPLGIGIIWITTTQNAPTLLAVPRAGLRAHDDCGVGIRADARRARGGKSARAGVARA